MIWKKIYRLRKKAKKIPKKVEKNTKTA